jgi:hypothetical protein
MKLDNNLFLIYSQICHVFNFEDVITVYILYATPTSLYLFSSKIYNFEWMALVYIKVSVIQNEVLLPIVNTVQ